MGYKLQGSTYIERYNAPSREAALAQWGKEFPGLSAECVVRIEKIA